MNVYAIRAIYGFELARTWRTLMQSIAGPVISTSLYFIVFGGAIGAISIRKANACSAMATASAHVRPQLNFLAPVSSLLEAICRFQSGASQSSDVVAAPSGKVVP